MAGLGPPCHWWSVGLPFEFLLLPGPVILKVLCSGITLASLGSLSEMQIPGPTLRPPTSESLGSGPKTLLSPALQGVLCAVKFEKWSPNRRRVSLVHRLYWRKWVTMSPFMKIQAEPRLRHPTCCSLYPQGSQTCWSPG